MKLTLAVLGRRVRRVERWELIRCLRLLSASLWLLEASVAAAEFMMESAPSIRLTTDGDEFGDCLSNNNSLKENIVSV